MWKNIATTALIAIVVVLALAGGGMRPASASGPAPVANAGPDIRGIYAHEGVGYINLDGRASSDSDGSIVSYVWTENSTTVATQAFQSVALTTGVHNITLTVTDNSGHTATDTVSVDINLQPVNPDKYYCFDVDGNRAVNATDLMLVAQAFGLRFGQSGYTRLKDWNADRTINSIDLMGTAQDFTPQCPVEDQMIRTSAAAIERYQDVNAAIADGFVQVTQFVPGQGRHMVKSSRFDLTFDPAQPEGLLYEPDSSTPGGWRLGGALYVIPYAQYPYVPDGFPTTDDVWHYHDALCFYSNGTVTMEDQATCTSRGGSYQTNVGWLLHLWTYVPVADGDGGRYSAMDSRFMGLP